MKQTQTLIIQILATIVVFLALPVSVFAITTDNLQYTVDQAANSQIVATCADPSSLIQLYNITSGALTNYPIPAFACGNVGTNASVGDKFALLELSGGRCDFESYDQCKAESFFLGEADITIGNTSIPNSGGGGGSSPPPSLYTDKSTYAPGDTVQAYCQLINHSLELYDISFGIDNVGTAGVNVAHFPCGSPSPITFDGIAGHTYALLEYAFGQDCSLQTQTYVDCQSAGYLRGETHFTVADTTVGGGIPVPTVSITAPKAGTVFSHAGTIGYQTTNTSQTLLFYSDKIADGDTFVSDTSMLSIIKMGAPPQGPYTWDASALTPGTSYRVLVEALDAKQANFTQAISDIFTVDFSLPQFIVKTDPPATRGGDVTITVDASKVLGQAPTTTVMQQGGAPIQVVMKGTGTHYTGTYSVVDGYDGVATISVSGADMVGNAGTSIVSGGTFAVGVEPPPSPKVSAPLNDSVTSTSTVNIAGTMRPDTSIAVLVNGVDTYTAAATSTGRFAIIGIKLDPKSNRGVNVLSIASKDQAGLLSAAVPISIKYNLPPVVAIDAPAADTTLGGLSSLSAKASDGNGDPLQFTYQIIPEGDFNASTASTSSGQATATSASSTAWTTIADAIPTSGFSWDSSEAEDGPYMLRVIASDGIASTVSTSSRIFIKNTLPFFRFEDGRKTLASTSTVTVIGRAEAPTSISPVPGIVQIQYSLDNGKKWRTVPITSGSSTPEALFSVTFYNLKEGEQGIVWRAKDTRGLYGRSNHPIILDTTPPAAPIVDAPALGSLISNSDDTDAQKSGVQIRIVGTAEPLSTVALVMASTSLSVKTSVDGTFTFRDIDVGVRGPHRFALTATDEAGNMSSVATTDFIYDNPPVVTMLTPKDGRGLHGHATLSWSVTDIDNVPISGITLAYRARDGAYHILPINNAASGSYQWDASSFPEGTGYELQLTAGDGFATSTDTVGFAIDNTPPSLDTFTVGSSRIGKKGLLTAHGTASDSLSGIEYVEYAIAPQDSTDALQWYTGIITSGFLRQSASYTISYPSTLEDGSYRLFVRAVDGAGNTSPEQSADFIVDTTAPRVGGFTFDTAGVHISPDRDGLIELYAHSSATFAVSLESDTASASITIATTTIPLHINAASGLWEGSMADMHSVATSTPILLSATDALGNTEKNKQIGALALVSQGTVSDVVGFLTTARIRVLIFDDNAHAYVPYSSATVPDSSPVNTNGEYQLALPAGSYELQADAPGYTNVTRAVLLERSGIVSESFTLEKSQGIWDYVRSFIESVKSIL